jgi:autotransporter-associated beta strand protein
MRTWSVLSASAVAAALTAATYAAAPVVYTNVSNLLPNKANQVVLVYVTGEDVIQAENLCFLINDGGYGPTITGVEILSGTIFAASNIGLIPPRDTTSFNSQGICIAGTCSGRLALPLTATNDKNITTTDNGLLATLTLSTVGATGSSFTLDMANMVYGPTLFFGPGSPTPIYAADDPHNQLTIGSSATRQWNINGGGSWDSDAHWTPFAPYTSGDVADFSTALASGTAVITLEGKRVVGALNFNNTSGSYDLQGGAGGSLLLDNGTQPALIAGLAGKHTVSVPTTLSAATTVSVASASTLTLAGGLSGSSAALSLVGSGKLILTGSANSYGATTIAPGSTMQVGNGAAGGSFGTAAVTNNGSLILDNMAQPLNVSMAGFGDNIINGTVSITTTYTVASTVINATGLMQVDDGGALMDGSIANNGRLAFNRSDAFPQADAISGSGTLTQMGAGTTTLTAAANYSGPTVISAGQLTFGGGVSHTIAGVSGTGSLAVASDTLLTSDGVNMPAGSLTIAGTQTIRSSASQGAYQQFTTGNSAAALSGTTKVSDLTITGSLDIKNNAVIVVAADSTNKATLLATLAGQLGTSITSSTAVTDAKYALAEINNASLGATTFGGLAVDANCIIVTETLKGDADLDGGVGPLDLAKWKVGFGNPSEYSVTNGDFDHDGGVGPLDLAIWKANFGASVLSNPAPSDFTSGGLITVPSASFGGGVSAVPEPASLVALEIGAVLLLCRRRRRQ